VFFYFFKRKRRKNGVKSKIKLYTIENNNK